MSNPHNISEITELPHPFAGDIYSDLTSLFVRELYKEVAQLDWKFGRNRTHEEILTSSCPAIESDAMRIFYITAEESQVVAGAIAYYSENSATDRLRRRNAHEIKLLAVERKYRGNGLATRLMGHVEDIARNDGVQEIKLRRVFEGAVSLYKTLGYVEQPPIINLGSLAKRRYSKTL